MDIIAEMPQLRAMLDVRVFLSTLASQWKSTRAHEAEKHNRYVTHQDGRRCTNMKLYAAVVNTYGKVGKEFEDFASVVDSKNRGKARGRDLTNLLSLLGVYANAEKVVLTHAPALKRALCGDVVVPLHPRTPKQLLPRPRELMQRQLIFATMRLKRSTQKLRYAQSFVEIFLIQMGRSSSTARDANRTTPTRDGQIIAQNTTPSIPK